ALSPEVRADQTQSAKAMQTCARASDVGKIDARGFAHDHVLDVTSAIDEDADQAVELVADLCEVSCELHGHEGFAFDLPPKRCLEPLELVGLEALGVPIEGFHTTRVILK